MKSVVDREAAIRSYLQFLTEPESLVDQAEVTELSQAVESATDPIDRLKAIAALERARQPVETDYRAVFVKHAKAWADANGVTASAFVQLGVPRDALVEAGLAPARGSATSGRGGGVGVGRLKSVLSTLPQRFIGADLVAAAGGGSPMTVRKALKELEADGRIRRLGPIEGWSSRGRAPILFERT